MVPKQNPNPPQWPRFNTRMDIAAQHRPRCIAVLNTRTPERQNVRTPLGITQTVAPSKGLATTRGRWRADKRWTGVLDRVTALLAPKSFHSLLSFSSLSGTPFWCCGGAAVDSCSPIRCSALNCCLNRVISVAFFWTTPLPSSNRLSTRPSSTIYLYHPSRLFIASGSNGAARLTISNHCFFGRYRLFMPRCTPEQ